MRLSIINFAGTVRTLVAVGTVRDWSMLAASALAMPLRGFTSSTGASSAPTSASDTTGVGEVGACAGIGCSLGAMEVVFAMGDVTGEGSSASDGTGAGVAGAGGSVTPAREARDSKSGHQLFSTS